MTYKVHTCLRRLRYSYLVVLCAPSDWKSGHLYATPAGGSIRGHSGKDSILAFDDIRYEKDSVLILSAIFLNKQKYPSPCCEFTLAKVDAPD